MPPWSKLWIELYGKDGYQGRWEINPGSGCLVTEDYLPQCVEGIRADERYRDAHIRFCEEGDEIVVGVFNGKSPPNPPKRGTVYEPPFPVPDPVE
jgi:hypothetical protein